MWKLLVLVYVAGFAIVFCDASCPSNEVYDVCPAPCPPRRCDVDDRVIRCAAPPQPGDAACKPGCRCVDGYARLANGTCVLRDQCEQPLVCDYENYEIYDSCPAPCPGDSCDVDPALVLCAPNPEYGDPRCKPACRCFDGYARNTSNKCVPRDQCAPICGPHEKYSSCTNGGCGHRNCSQIGKPVLCIDPILSACIKGCICVDGYLRNYNGKCVPEKECPTSCPSNEVYDVCPAPCPPRRCDVDDRVIRCAAPPQPGDAACKPGCRCVEGYARLANGTCVLRDQCEQPLVCDYENYEIYDSCPAPCPGDSCDVDPARVLCAPNPEYGDPRCKPACRCFDGYARNTSNKCVPRDQCD